jgi:hypothetical protein
MKTYLNTHVRAVTLQQSSMYRKGLFLLLSTLVTYFAFAGEEPKPAQEAEFSLPLVLKTFNASLNNKKVNLTWVTGHEKDLSHFIIERSTNGRDYTEVAIVFAMGNPKAVQSYNFADLVDADTRSIIYYRLRMLDSRKRQQFSPVRIIRISDAASNVKVTAYPNPVVNELRVTVPASWQNKQVSYELYNLSGNMIKRISTNHASQTETLNVKELGNGTYIVKAYTQSESASQRVVKI